MIDRKAVYEKYNGHCAYCGKKINYKDMQVDHFVPIRSGGTDDFENLMPSCRRCNHYKRASNLEGFREKISQIPVKLLRDSYIYKVAADFGFVPVEEKTVEFYFEKAKKEEWNDR
jgi:hypothetical protein|uniref:RECOMBINATION ENDONUCLEASE VII n=1 Tax=virus sp. ctyMK1 TaxID=2828002 RepID=A0A8S5RF07_9VIRU|nr:MAG TPA: RECOMBINATION ENDONUCLEASE VII [virus sp. ctyMK1]